MVSSETEAKQILRSGTLLDAVRHAFNPGGGYTPQQVGFMRVNPGTQATRVVVNSAGDAISVKTADYGLHTNQVKAKIEAGTTSGKKFTTQFQNEAEIVTDNIIRESISIEYVGSGSVATMVIGNTGLVVTVDAVEDLNVPFATFSTIEELVAYINDQEDYVCTALTGDQTQLSSHLDAVASGDITSAYTAYSTLQALIEAIAANPHIGEATYIGTSRLVPSNDTDWVYFTGAIDGAYTTTEWGVTLTALEVEDIQLVGASSSDAAVHALIRAHCVKMNGREGRNERQFIVGGTTGETEAQVIARAKILGNGVECGAICYPGFYDYDFDTGVVKLWSPVYYAAKELGRQTALALNTPATRKGVGHLGWEKTLSIASLDNLIAGGVWAGQRTRDGLFVNARSITVFQGSNLLRNEFSIVREILFATRDLREAIEQSIIGKAGTQSVYSEIDSIVAQRLSQYTNEFQIFTGNAAAPAYSNYRKSINGDVVTVDYDAQPTSPVNFNFITGHYQVFAQASA
jgi:hypothetical protein